MKCKSCRKYCYFFTLLCCFVCSLFCACDGLQVSHNGNLDGMWKLVEVDTIQSSNTIDYADKAIHWSFQSDLLELDDKLYKHESCFMRFIHTGEELIVSDPCLNDRFSSDPKIKEISKVSPFGINALEEKFEIEELTHKKLVLRSKMLRLKFLKF